MCTPLPPTPGSSYLYHQLLICGAGGLLDLDVHFGEKLLALVNLLTQGVVVLDQAQDVAATLAGPQAVARDQAGCGRGDHRATTVAGEGVHVISGEQRGL